MGLSLQKKLELAGALSKVQPELQRLHLVRKPKKRRGLRTAVIATCAFAVGTAVAAVIVLRRRALQDDAFAASRRVADGAEDGTVGSAFDPDPPSDE